jgi:hypothetical protein
MNSRMLRPDAGENTEKAELAAILFTLWGGILAAA